MDLTGGLRLDGVKDFIYFDEVEPTIREYLNGMRNLIEAETTHFGEFDKNWRWLRGEITGFGGIPNHGKSKFVIFLTALKLFYAEWKVAIYSPETTHPEFFFSNYIHTLTGYSVFSRSRKPTISELDHYKKAIQDRLFLCEPEKMPTFKGIMERFQKAYEYHGCDIFVIDPFNCLEREWEYSRRDDRYVGEFLDHYRDFCRTTKTCGIVVMHPNAQIKQKKDSLDLECPTMYNLAGGAMWANKLDNLGFIHRPFHISERDNSNVLVRFTKIKKREVVGQGGDVEIDFNFLTNRYSLNGYEPNFRDEYEQSKFSF